MLARLATRSDVPALIELMREFYAEASFPLDAEWAAHAFESVIDEPAFGAVWILESGGATAGHVVLSVRFAMEFGGLTAYIDDLFVRPAHRRKGVARAGLEALFAECQRRGCRAVHVEVGSDNHAAIALYRGYGLEPAGDGRQLLRLALEPA